MHSDRKRLVFLDIDGTLLIPGAGRMTDRTVQALRRARENGHILCICTGRTCCEIPDTVKGFDAVISAAGACVMWKDKVLLAEYLSDSEKQAAVELLEEAGAIYAMEGFDDLYMKKEVYERFCRVLEGRSEEERKVLGLFQRTRFYTEVSETEKVHKCSYFYAEKDGGWFRERLKKRDMSVAAFSQGEARGNCGEITKTAFNKGSAVRCLSDYLGIPIEDTIAVGDSENDLEMLRAAGVGIAMGNALGYVKDAADDVTKSVEEDGVYHAFLKYGLITEKN